jgi:alpha-tubulin suppressor-like RCC1 family protein
MSKITRATQKQFGSTAGTNTMAEFGSLFNSYPVVPTRFSGSTITPAIIQTLANYLTGWTGAAIGGNSPALEDMNAVCFLFSYQLGYLLQTGIPEWDAGTTYYIGSIAQDGTGGLYQSIANSNTNNALSNPSFWARMFVTASAAFTASGTFTAPSGVTRVNVQVEYPNQYSDYQGMFPSTQTGSQMGYVDANGMIWVWGQNGSGQLGNGNQTNQSTPIAIAPAGLTSLKFRQVFLTGQGAGAVDEFGGLWTWGLNANGQLGVGNTTNTSTPLAILGAVRFQKLVQGSFDSGGGPSFAIDYAGNMWSWGANLGCLLGTGDATTTDAVSSPALVIGGHHFINADGANTTQMLAVDSAGGGWAWGFGTVGTSGTGANSGNISSPTAILGGIVWQRIIAMVRNGMGLDANGGIWMWGGNNNGIIGNNVSPAVTAAYSSPIAVVGGIVFKSLPYGSWRGSQAFTAAVDVNGNIWSWGLNTGGVLGDNTIVAKSSPVMVVGGIVFTNVFISTQQNTAYGLDVNGNLWGWGSNSFGQLGVNVDPTVTPSFSSPVQVAGSHKWLWMWPGQQNASVTAIDTTGQVWTWGLNSLGQLGDGTTTSRSSPVMITGVPRPFQIAPKPSQFSFDVTPGNSYPVEVGLGKYAVTFNGNVLGYLGKKVTISYG